MKKIAVIYHCFPHYRKAIVEALSHSDKYDYVFIGSSVPVTASIKNMVFPTEIEFHDAPCRRAGPFLLQNSIFSHINKICPDAVIILGNAWYISYWALCLKSMLLGKPVLMWTHGWIDAKENYFKKLYRNLFYRLANGLLLYGERAIEIGVSNGFDAKKLFFIGNSLDFDEMSEVFDGVRRLDRANLKEEMSIPLEASVIMCSARLTHLCKFDILIQAVASIDRYKHKISIVLIGDGPEKEKLAMLANKLDVDVRFLGACYDEKIISKYYHLADMTVSPGKVGLTAIHSLTYGTPVISHNNLNKQMPEVEAIIPSVTGGLFEYDNIKSLADEILKWVDCKQNNPEVIDWCRDIISNRFSPSSQVKFIESALSRCAFKS